MKIELFVLSGKRGGPVENFQGSSCFWGVSSGR